MDLQSPLPSFSLFLGFQANKLKQKCQRRPEPIYLDNKIIGKTTSGNYSFNYNKNLSFGYINSKLSNEQLANKNLYIEIEKKKYPAELLTKPLKANNFKNI